MLCNFIFSRCDASSGMVAAEVILPEENASDGPDSDCIEKQEEQMGIFQILDRLEEAVDALLNTESAASTSTLQQNLKAKNTKKLIICTICTKSFATSGALKTHMRVHTGEKPYACSQCTKSFSTSSLLLSHLRVHTGEKPFTCSHCTKTFAQLANLRSHLLAHSGEKPWFLCTKNLKILNSQRNIYEFTLGENPTSAISVQGHFLILISCVYI